MFFRHKISIHALLAESDTIRKRQVIPIIEFLSTLSLRRATAPPYNLMIHHSEFLSTLSLRRATSHLSMCNTPQKVFLSTLSLRRATHYDNYNLHCIEISIHALLAESDTNHAQGASSQTISIHALLAESDNPKIRLSLTIMISIHALLAESDSIINIINNVINNFYPRSPCGERLGAVPDA